MHTIYDQTTAAPHLSQQYQLVSTRVVLNAFEREGWAEHRSSIVRARVEARKGFQFHSVTLRHSGITPIEANTVRVSGWRDLLYPEIVITNSYDGAHPFSIMAGLYRQVCSNGLVVSDAMLEAIRLKHIGPSVQSDVRDAIDTIIARLPNLTERIQAYQDIEMSKDEQGAYAMRAAQIRFTQPEQLARIDPAALLTATRREDSNNSLWTTFNRVQERLIEKGGHYMQNAKRPVMRKVRSLTAPRDVVRVNRALWELTEETSNELGRV